MSGAPHAQDLRSATRYGIADGQSLHATLTVKTLDCEDKPLPAQILDLSRQGAKVLVESSLPTHCGIRLSISDATVGLEYGMDGAICWCRPAQDDHWLIGCSFEQPLPHHVIIRLAEAGLIDRRSDERLSYEIAVRCRRQLNNEELDGTITNVSAGGFGVRLNKPAPLDNDERILLQIGDTSGAQTNVLGRVCWHGSASDPGAFGCGFISKEGYAVLRERLAALKIANQRGNRRPKLLRLVGLILGTAIVAGGAVLLMRGVPNF